MKMLLTFMVICLASSMSLSQDTCADAPFLDASSFPCFTQDFSSASGQVPYSSCEDANLDVDQWFYFIADGPEIDILANHTNAEDVVISLLRFNTEPCDPIKFTELQCGTNTLFNQNLLEVGETYFIKFSVHQANNSTVDICVKNPDITPPPANDLPCDAEVLMLDSTCVMVSTINAEPDTELFQCEPGYTSEVWYEFTMSEGLFFGVEIYLESIDVPSSARVILAEFVAEDCSNQFVIRQQFCGLADGFVFDYVSLNAGSKYFISVATADDSQREFNLCVKEMEALAHTDPCQALDVTPNDSCISFDTYYSIFEYDLPNCDFSNQKIWYKFYTGQDLNSIDLQLSKLGDQENIFLGLGYYQGNWCENQFNWVGNYCGEVSGARITAEDLMPNQLYHIVVGTNFGFTGEFDLCINGDYDSPFTNDTACKAYAIDNATGCIGGSSQYGGIDLTDTICFDVSPVAKTWYKVDLETYNRDIEVSYVDLSGAPLHKVELGYFPNGCLDSFLVMSEFCGTEQESSISFSFPDSTRFAYISVALPTTEIFNYNICVNARDFGFQCNANDFCEESEWIGQLDFSTDACFTACAFGATQENTQEFYSGKYGTSWYSFATAENSGKIEFEFSEATTQSFHVGIIEDTDCSYSSFMASEYIQMTNFQNFTFDLEPSTNYKLAFTPINNQGGAVNICISTNSNNICSLKDKIEVISTSKGSPLTGPFQEDEWISLCYTLESFDPTSTASCQWLQGIVPTFGEGWDPLSFDQGGLPLSSTTIQPIANDVEWLWRSNVHSSINNSSRRISSQTGKMELCHISEQNCEGSMIQQGDLLPPGWYAANISQGGTHPDSTYGDGISCDLVEGPWEICFDLKVGDVENEGSLDIVFHTFSDGEIGYTGPQDTSCMTDNPAKALFEFECMSVPVDTVKTDLACSGNGAFLDLPDDMYYFWIVENNPRVEGEAPGSGNIVPYSLSNETQSVQRVNYFIQAYNTAGCHIFNYSVSLDVYPEIQLNRPALYTVCQDDVVVMDEIIDLNSLVLGNFQVDWQSPILEDKVDAIWDGDVSATIPYGIYSEAGCTFFDTLSIHVEDVIVTEFLDTFVACRGDLINFADIIDLNAIITDPFTVVWDLDVDDEPNVSYAFESSANVPFVITGQSGCKYADELDIHVPFVAINVLGKDEYCSVDTISISAGYQFDQPHTKYWLIPGQDTIFSSGFSRPAQILEAGENYLEFQLYTEEGCPFYDYDTLTMYDYPEFTFNQDSVNLGICPYDSLTLNIQVVPDYIGFEWETPNGSSMEETIVSNAEGWYTVVSGFENEKVSCINRDSFHLEIYPAVETEFIYDNLVCAGDSSFVKSVDPNYQFTWDIGEFSSELNLAPGNYTVTVANGPGCISIFDIDIAERELPSPEFFYDDVICEGDSTIVTANNNAFNYAWSTGGQEAEIVSKGGAFSVTVTDDEMCMDSFQLEIDVLQYPEVEFSYELISDSLFLYNSTLPGSECQWMINDEFLPDGLDTVLVITEGDYVISLSCANGSCSDFELDTISYIVVGVKDQAILNWTLYPNPASDQFTLQFDQSESIDKVRIFDLYGKLVQSLDLDIDVSKIRVETNLVSGIYLVEVQSGSQRSVKRLILNR